MQGQTDYWTMFADEAKRIGSPLYAHLAANIRDNEKLRQIAAHAKPGQPQANLVLAAVHYLMLDGVQHPLAQHYPSVQPAARPSGDAFPKFLDFCQMHERAVVELVSKRITNTNEVARSTSLYPAFDHVARQTSADLHMIEIGPSAGLNLNWDRYRYIYRRNGSEILSRGEPAALMTLQAELRGDLTPPLAPSMPKVVSRVGLELNPVDLQNPEDRLWLKALIFPELTPRFARLEGAIATALSHPSKILFGNALELLEGVTQSLPSTGIPVVYHSFVTYQFSTAMRERLQNTIVELSRSRPLYRVSIEWDGADHPVAVTRYENGRAEKTILADCNPHGAWLEWRLDPARGTK